MPSIRMLDSVLVNKIAAGEVIDRPASVVKELVENALDSDATRILVEIEDGGRKLIRVSDDGAGIAPEELPLAFASHATSKIVTADDLFAVRTLGFRGEALASIAAVSYLNLISRARGAEEGASLESRGGKLGSLRAAGSPDGTVAEVRNLFFNVPVRRRFLRSAPVEFSHIAEAVTRLALAHGNVRFELRHDGRLEFALPQADSPRSRIARLFGDELAKALIVARGPLEEAAASPGPDAGAPEPQPGGAAVEAWIGPPVFSRPNAQGQYYFVNGRFVRDRSLAHAVAASYRELLLDGRYPVVFLYLTVPSSEVDVNVHPTKIEVRFRNPWRLHDRLVAILRKALSEADLILTVPMPVRKDAPKGFDPARVQGAIHDFFARSGAPGQQTASPALPISPSAPPAAPQTAASQPLVARPTSPQLNAPPAGVAVPPIKIPLSSPSAVAGPPSPIAAPSQLETPLQSPDSLAPAIPAPLSSPPLRPVQVHGRYLVVEAPDGILVVDQHALHERVRLEAIRRQWERDGVARQRLLIPAVVELPPRDLARLEEARAALESFGIEWEDFGTNTIVVRAVPDFLKDADPARLLRDFLEFAAEAIERPEGKAQAGREAAAAGLVDEILYFLACRSAVKAGEPLAPQEIDALLRDWDALELAATCAHGRPVALKLTLADLERYFKRT
jgi:DNA mismatch repair protein MutL